MFLYPADSKSKSGKLRLLYEVMPHTAVSPFPLLYGHKPEAAHTHILVAATPGFMRGRAFRWHS